MVFKNGQPSNLKADAKKSSKTLATIPKGIKVQTIGNKVIWDGGTPFIKIKFQGVKGYVNCRHLCGMYLKSNSTGSKFYPKMAYVSNGKSALKIKIPQQKQFNSFSKAHGCSLAAVTTALQFHEILKSPTEVYNFAKAHLTGYTGSKLTIFGCEKAINGIADKDIAEWHPFTGKSNKKDKERIKDAIMDGHIVLMEQKNPIHTNTVIGRKPNGKYVIATNGVVKETTLSYLIGKSLKGYIGRDKQRNWFRGAPYCAGYVIVKRKG